MYIPYLFVISFTLHVAVNDVQNDLSLNYTILNIFLAVNAVSTGYLLTCNIGLRIDIKVVKRKRQLVGNIFA